MVLRFFSDRFFFFVQFRFRHSDHSSQAPSLGSLHRASGSSSTTTTPAPPVSDESPSPPASPQTHQGTHPQYQTEHPNNSKSTAVAHQHQSKGYNAVAALKSFKAIFSRAMVPKGRRRQPSVSRTVLPPQPVPAPAPAELTEEEKLVQQFNAEVALKSERDVSFALFSILTSWFLDLYNIFGCFTLECNDRSTAAAPTQQPANGRHPRRCQQRGRCCDFVGLAEDGAQYPGRGGAAGREFLFLCGQLPLGCHSTQHAQHAQQLQCQQHSRWDPSQWPCGRRGWPGFGSVATRSAPAPPGRTQTRANRRSRSRDEQNQDQRADPDGDKHYRRLRGRSFACRCSAEPRSVHHLVRQRQHHLAGRSSPCASGQPAADSTYGFHRIVCGPASVSLVSSHSGGIETQAHAASLATSSGIDNGNGNGNDGATSASGRAHLTTSTV